MQPTMLYQNRQVLNSNFCRFWLQYLVNLNRSVAHLESFCQNWARDSGSLRDALAATARTLARLVAGGAAAGLALPGPEPGQPDDRPPAWARRARRSAGGGDRQARVAPYLAALPGLDGRTSG